MATLFDEQYEQVAITRIKKFAALSEKMGYVPVLGFSGGKDSQVCYDLCLRAGIRFRAVFNHCFETAETLRFIREQYPEVEWRREVKQGFFENIRVNHGGMLPTVEAAYCCADYKHNRKYIDKSTIIGVRRAESTKRAKHKVFEVKNKSTLKRSKNLMYDYFAIQCVASGATSELQLMPIVDWSDSEVWAYIERHRLPVNPEYENSKRVGCIVCPKATFTANSKALLRYPKLIDAAINAKTNDKWVLTGDKEDCSDRKAEYICRWLNHSFRPFTKKQRELADMVIDNYNNLKNK